MSTITWPVCTQGETYDHTLTLTLAGGIDDCDIILLVKRRLADSDESALLRLDSFDAGGIEKLSSTSIRVLMTDEQTAALPGGKKLVAGIKALLPDGTSKPFKSLSLDFFVEPHPVLETSP